MRRVVKIAICRRDGDKRCAGRVVLPNREPVPGGYRSRRQDGHFQRFPLLNDSFSFLSLCRRWILSLLFVVLLTFCVYDGSQKDARAEGKKGRSQNGRPTLSAWQRGQQGAIEAIKLASPFDGGDNRRSERRGWDEREETEMVIKWTDGRSEDEAGYAAVASLGNYRRGHSLY